ncbi:MAG: hypothetical protein JXB07_06455 [Anaerolineae bacterium]|nr:hypothetical protein [Anaerolineae bacterium]
MVNKSIFAYAQINARVQPIDRGDRYEDPLQEALEEKGFGEVTGGGTMLSANKEIAYCGIDLDLDNLEQSIPFVCKILTQCGAPKGSKLQVEVNGEQQEIPFGILEGLAIYLNGSDLPDEVYQTCDINHVYEEINRLLGERGEIQGYWKGPTETALYLYGYSVAEMKQLIEAFMSEYPLCEKARFETIA